MRRLYHIWLSPACRTIRIALAEKELEAELEVEPYWERRASFLALNPAGELPVLVEADGAVIVGEAPIAEYLEEVYRTRPLLGTAPLARAEVRRLITWFTGKFGREVSQHLYGEKFVKRFLHRAPPDSEALRAGLANLRTHLDYIGYLSDRRRWLAGDEFSLADITAAAHLSVVDYLGDVPWENYEPARDWYARVKSRPAFRSILSDYIAGMPPPKHYADLDF
jgi:glutathione S-transferase